MLVAVNAVPADGVIVTSPAVMPLVGPAVDRDET